MKEIFTSGSERGVKLFYMAEYCDTLQSKEKRNREHKACLNERAILRLLDHDVTWKSGYFSAAERGDISKNSGILQLVKMWLSCGNLLSIRTVLLALDKRTGNWNSMLVFQ